MEKILLKIFPELQLTENQDYPNYPIVVIKIYRAYLIDQL